jgi:hypothetical protein
MMQEVDLMNETLNFQYESTLNISLNLEIIFESFQKIKIGRQNF